MKNLIWSIIYLGLGELCPPSLHINSCFGPFNSLYIDYEWVWGIISSYSLAITKEGIYTLLPETLGFNLSTLIFVFLKISLAIAYKSVSPTIIE